MKELPGPKSQSCRGVAIAAVAIGALSVGVFAVGALAIWRLAVGRIVVGKAEFKSLAIHDLTVTRLRAAEIIVSDSLHLPASDADPEIV